MAEDVVDRVLDLGEFDAYTELAVGFPLRVVPDFIMGAAEEGRENLLRYATFLFESLGPRTPRVERVFEEIGDVQAAIEWTARSCMRENVSADSFGARIWAAVDSGELSAEDAPNLVRSLVGAGIDTTINSIAITLHLLSTHPEQYALLHEQPTLGKFAYDEALRRHSPIRSVYRTPARDLELLGVQVSEGQKIMSMPGSANLDPERWGNTVLDYDITRDTGGHLTFGFGIHACVGSAIARLEADVLLTAFARRVRSIEPTAPAEPLLNNFLRGFGSVPVRIKIA